MLSTKDFPYKGTVRKLIFSAMFVSTFVGCKKEERPKDVLDKQQLSSLMIDLYLTEARLSGYPIIRDSSLKLFLPHESALLAKRNLSDSTLRKTYAYYLEHPNEFDQVYDIIIDSLMVLEKQKTEQGQIKK